MNLLQCPNCLKGFRRSDAIIEIDGEIICLHCNHKALVGQDSNTVGFIELYPPEKDCSYLSESSSLADSIDLYIEAALCSSCEENMKDLLIGIATTVIETVYDETIWDQILK